MRPFGPKPIPEHRWFESKPLPARLLILFAGVTMNIVLTYAIMTGIFATAGRTVLLTRVVAEVDTLSRAGAALAAVQPGDTILRVDGAPVETWSDIERRIVSSTGAELRIETSRGAVAVPVAAPGAPTREDVARALVPYQPPVIDEVLPGGPAQRAGVSPGDSIVAIDGRPVRTFGDLVDAVSPAAGRELRLEVVRGGETREILVRPESTQVTGGGRRASTVVGRIGATPRAPTRSERLGFTEAAALGWTRTWQMGGLIFTTLRDLGTGDVPLSELGGPGTIAVASAQAAQRGPVELLLLIALLSINVAVLNLLPIPILDGGQILLNVVESAKGSEFSPRTREYILRFGLVAILVLFAIVLFNDTSRLVDFVRGIWN